MGNWKQSENSYWVDEIATARDLMELLSTLPQDYEVWSEFDSPIQDIRNVDVEHHRKCIILS